jgi:hypothetical protein
METRKITAWTRLLSRVIGLVVVLIVATTVGKWLMSHPPASTSPPAKPLPKPAIDWAQVDKDLVHSLQAAASTAEAAATQKLDAWTEALMKRVDADFLEWYFNYWNQQTLALKGMWYWSVGQVLSDAPAAAARITEDIQEQFATRVLRPEIAQMELERLTSEVLHVYVTQVREQLSTIPEKYQLPQADWERYLDDIAVLTARTEGNRDVPLTLKALTASTAAGTIALGQALGPPLKNIAGKVSGKLTGKAAATLATKTGVKVGARVGGKLLGPITGIGIVIWDVWDHRQTQKVERPLLRQAIADYFAAMKQNLLHEPESGVLSVLHTIERNIVSSLRKQS